MAAAFGALLDRRFAHLLTFFEMTGTRFTQIFVSRHGRPSLFIVVSFQLNQED